jgi:hypothetical protein
LQNKPSHRGIPFTDPLQKAGQNELHGEVLGGQRDNLFSDSFNRLVLPFVRLSFPITPGPHIRMPRLRDRSP